MNEKYLFTVALSFSLNFCFLSISMLMVFFREIAYLNISRDTLRILNSQRYLRLAQLRGSGKAKRRWAFTATMPRRSKQIALILSCWTLNRRKSQLFTAAFVSFALSTYVSISQDRVVAWNLLLSR